MSVAFWVTLALSDVISAMLTEKPLAMTTMGLSSMTSWESSMVKLILGISGV